MVKKKVKYCHPPRNKAELERCDKCGTIMIVMRVSLTDPYLWKDGLPNKSFSEKERRE